MLGEKIKNMNKFLIGLAAIIMIISSWIGSAIVTLIALAFLNLSFILKLLVAITVFNTWHWGGYFLGTLLMHIGGTNNK